MAGRAFAAVALTLGFYTLALAVAMGCIAGPIALWASSGHGNAWLTIVLVATGVTILRAIAPSRDTFVAPGPLLTPAGQPELHAQLQAVAGQLGETVPDVYLAGDVNASVAEVSNGMFRGRRRIMILGLPLLAALTPAQTRAVVAHEYGHYIGGDTRFSAWIWRTRVAVLVTVQALDNEDSWFQRVIVRTPFLLYSKMFLRLTNAISRRQEFAADAVAVQVEGSETQGATLRNVSAAAAAYDGFWGQDLAFALNRGRRPPIASGFQRFLADHEIRASLNEIVASEISEGETNPYDSHPTLADRLRAIGAEVTAETSPPAPEDAATTLLRDVDRLENELLVSQFGDEVKALETMTWEDAGMLYVADGDAIAEEHARAFAGLTVAESAQAWADAQTRAPALRETFEDGGAGISDEELAGFWRHAVGRLVVAALRRAGWSIEAAPGDPLICRRGNDIVKPYQDLEQAAGDGTAATWSERCAALGIGGLALARAPEPVAAQQPAPGQSVAPPAPVAWGAP
ncbi:MAG: hypothetical protein QOG15_3072 [Solirubrobacteraceae bacterium]|nr:hypothetical protein [Solirubrobacteraceae bacterium]